MENTKLILKFMGSEPNEIGEYDLYSNSSFNHLFVNIKSLGDDKHYFTVEEMYFDRSWDWLMMVVGKISETIAGGITYGVQGTLLVADIEKTYTDVIECIKMINKLEKRLCELQKKN
jgi:hypothetical protein